MNIVTERLPTIASLKTIFRLSSLNTLLPSIEEMIQITALKKVKPFVYHASDGEKTFAAAIFILEKRRIHKINLRTFSLLGHDYFDYNFFFCEKNVFSNFINFISREAKENKADAIILENTILDYHAGKYEKKHKVFNFNANFQSENSFQAILQKKSLKRHHNKAKNLFEYSCEHKIGTFEKKDIETMGDLHKERWNLDEIKSAFSEPERIQLYLTHKENKILTILRNNDDIIAMHYGMILGATILWHTPAINVKYLDYSPIELLLFEVAKYCKENNFSILDYGLGDEKYKERFSNSYREVVYHLVSISYKSLLISLLTRFLDPKIAERCFFKIVTLIRRKIKIFNNINYYRFKRKIEPCNDKNEESSMKLLIVNNFIDLVELFRKNKIFLKRYQYSRIKSGDVLLCLVNDQCILSYGWGTRHDTFFVSEIEKNICNKERFMLYDFNTPVDQRRKGYYACLLRKISEIFNSDEIVIFTEKKNIPSNKAILRAGFNMNKFVGIRL